MGVCVPNSSPLLSPLSSKVACGVSHLHQHNIVYYDLKSSNILVFQFPTAQESLQVQRSARGKPYILGKQSSITKICASNLEI